MKTWSELEKEVEEELKRKEKLWRKEDKLLRKLACENVSYETFDELCKQLQEVKTELKNL